MGSFPSEIFNLFAVDSKKLEQDLRRTSSIMSSSEVPTTNSTTEATVASYFCNYVLYGTVKER